MIGMDYALLPPEVNSARMYSGAGAGPMVAAAAAWDRLASMLGSAAASYRSVVSELTDGQWRGPASASMAGAAEPYVEWMNTTATQAEQTANQARAAATAFEAAFAATVPPPVIAANRATLLALIATNFFGQNLPAIAANQAEYAEMWAQDATAMYGYTAHSAAAMVLSPVAPAPRTTNPAAASTQAAAQAAAGTQAPAQSATSDFLSSLPNIFGPLNNFLSNNTTVGINNALGPVGTVLAQFTGPLLASEGIQLFMFPLMTATGKFAMLGPMAAMGAATGAGLMSSTTGEAGYTLVGSYEPGSGTGGVSAGLGRAAPIGRLSVPPTWAAASGEVRLAVSALPTAGSSALPPAGLGVPAGGFVPPVGGVANTPRSGEARVRSAATFKAIQSHGGASDTHDGTDNQWAYGAAAADVGGLSGRELGELDQLREQMADLALECDAMALLMKEGTN